MIARHQDNLSTLCSFREQILVVCPKCASCAQVSRIAAEGVHSSSRVTCLRCGFSKQEENRGFLRRRAKGLMRNGISDLPLWLERPCCGETLWALNYDHLAYIASYVAAAHRMRHPNTAYLNNSSMASRFPRWMISAKNRCAILRGIQWLREKKDPSGR